MTLIQVIGNIETSDHLYGLKHRTDDNLYRFYIYLQQHSKYTIEIYNRYEKDEILSKNSDDTIVLVLPGCILEYLNELKGIKIVNLEDVGCHCGIYCCLGTEPCRCNNTVNYISSNKYDCLFYRYKTYIVREQYKFMTKQFYFPHFIDSQINKNYELEKKYDVLLYGSVWAKVYPLRNKLKTVLEKSPFRVCIIDPAQPVRGENLAKLINESWITICTKSNNNLFLQKYIEAALNHSVICGDFPDLEEKVFGDNMIYLDYSMSSRQIIGIINSYLINKPLLQNMAKQAYLIAQSRYTYEVGCTTFDQYIDKIIHH